MVFSIARVGGSSTAKRFVQNLADDEDVRELVYCVDENLDWALAGSQDAGMLNTWVSRPSGETGGMPMLTERCVGDTDARSQYQAVAKRRPGI